MIGLPAPQGGSCRFPVWSWADPGLAIAGPTPHKDLESRTPARPYGSAGEDPDIGKGSLSAAVGTAQQSAEERIQSHCAGPRPLAGKLTRDPGMPHPCAVSLFLKPVASVLSLTGNLQSEQDRRGADREMRGRAVPATLYALPAHFCVEGE